MTPLINGDPCGECDACHLRLKGFKSTSIEDPFKLSQIDLYSVKEIYYTLQGEGYHTGRPSIFLRFSGCNLWSGLENDRKKHYVTGDTDFVGTDGANGGKYTAKQILEIILKLWPKSIDSKPYIVFTGGEPLLQVDKKSYQLYMM